MWQLSRERVKASKPDSWPPLLNDQAKSHTNDRYNNSKNYGKTDFFLLISIHLGALMQNINLLIEHGWVVVELCF